MEAILEAPLTARYVRPLGPVDDANSIGGKAAHLAQLIAAGFVVPPGFVIVTEAFERFGQGAVPEDLRREIVAAYRAMSSPRVAVRSSGVGEDGPGASFAGQYETLLDVDGIEALEAAVRECWQSAYAERLVDYRARHGGGAPRMAVLVQAMLHPDASGVAFTANPVTGARDEIVISAVRGVGDRLVSGSAAADEWIVRGALAERLRVADDALDAEMAKSVAALAKRVEAQFGCPQDIEWAFVQGKLWLLQARPITALPDVVEWRAPLAGGWMRNFRLGEWLPEPVTPLFESWLLARLEDGFQEFYRQRAGIRSEKPDHVLIHGWYFTSLNFMPRNPLVVLWQLLTGFLPKLLINGRRALAVFPPLVKYCIELWISDWREVDARYQREVMDARVDALAVEALPSLIDRLAASAAEYFALITLVGGYAWKSEVPLAAFYRKHLEPAIGGTHQELLQGLFIPARSAHDVQSLDWFRPTTGECGTALSDDGALERKERLCRAREQAEARARAVLAPPLLRRFNALLAEAQRFAPIRDEQVSRFTLAWPVMRRALRRIGEQLVSVGAIRAADDVHFLTREEVSAALMGRTIEADVSARRAAHERASRLAPPLLVGEPPPMVKSIFARVEAPFRREAARDAVVCGLPASPGTKQGPARIIRSVDDFSRFRDGDVLVAPATMPAWTPLFPRAAAVVTDIGSVIAHAALVAREYGIPAVVGTGNATTKLRDGELILVNGTTGTVHRASSEDQLTSATSTPRGP